GEDVQGEGGGARPSRGAPLAGGRGGDERSMKNILIAEDESTLREGLSQAFSESGFKVAQAASGREAIEKMERQVFDLVVTDLKMPGGDGMEVLRRARHVSEQTPVIIMTAFGTVEG